MISSIKIFSNWLCRTPTVVGMSAFSVSGGMVLGPAILCDISCLIAVAISSLVSGSFAIGKSLPV